jgi:hypothetical protein
MLVCLPFLSNAQEKIKMRDYRGKTKTKIELPSWSTTHRYTGDRHVFFPDYNTFYDPNRGYVYWKGSAWTTSTVVPTYMSKVDLNKARIQILEDEITVMPETRYRVYHEKYPAQKVEVVVPVPND